MVKTFQMGEKLLRTGSSSSSRQGEPGAEGVRDAFSRFRRACPGPVRPTGSYIQGRSILKKTTISMPPLPGLARRSKRIGVGPPILTGQRRSRAARQVQVHLCFAEDPVLYPMSPEIKVGLERVV